MKYTFTSSFAAMLANGRASEITPWQIIIDTDKQTITLSKRNKILIGVDEDTIAFRFIRRVTIDQHVLGADITISTIGDSITAYSMDKNDCKKIKEILMDYNNSKGDGIVFG